MSTKGGKRPKLKKPVRTDTEAEHSLVSEQDQLKVEERERQRDEISNAKQRRSDSDTDPHGSEDACRSSEKRDGP